MNMMNSQTAKVCTGELYPPNKWKLGSPAFLADLARKLSASGMPSSQIVFQAIDGLLSSDAVLYGFDGKPIDLFGEYEDGLDVIEWSFGGDWARGVRRILERAERPFRNQMKATPKLMMRILLLHYSVVVRDCQETQRCSNAVPDLR